MCCVCASCHSSLTLAILCQLAVSSLSVLRTARLMRVFKLARSWKELNRIITTILRSFSQVMYLSLLVVLFVFIFALMGMQLFGYKFGSCAVPGAQQVCPPGVTKCPDYPDCYVPCDLGSVFSWTAVPGKPLRMRSMAEKYADVLASSYLLFNSASDWHRMVGYVDGC